METIEIKKSNVQAAYAAADDKVKNVLAVLFGEAIQPAQEKDNRPITERIKTFEDACKALGENDMLVMQCKSNELSDLDADLDAYLKLRIICAALNEGWEPQFTEDEYRWYTWHWLYTQSEIDYMDDEERKKCHLITTGDYITEFAGFGSANSDDALSNASANFGSRLCLRSRELAVYCGKQFIKLWADFNLIRK